MDAEKIKEYGGYLPINGVGEEYFSGLGIKESNILRLNAARYAIIEAFRDSRCDKIWIPIYMCQSVFEALKNADIDFKIYNIDRDLLPVLDGIKENEIVLTTNYYGIMPDAYYEKILSRYKNVIFDNTQAFYASPQMRENVYNVYSPRKFFGVPDGAYLISNHSIDIDGYEQDVSYTAALYLLKAIETGTNAAYGDYLDNEKRISDAGARKMSKLTKHLLGGIDYENTRKVRKRNFEYLNSVLAEFSGFGTLDVFCDPMVYPLLLKSDANRIRKKIVENQIYVPQWWKWVLDEDDANEYEKYLSENLLPIPIDQRYTLDDMREMSKLILKIIKET